MAAGIERGVEEYSLRGLGGSVYTVDRLGIALQALSAISLHLSLDGQGDDELTLIRSQLEDISRSLQLLWQSYRDEMDSQAAAEERFRVTWVSANAIYAWTSPCSDNWRSIDLPSLHEFFLVQHC